MPHFPDGRRPDAGRQEPRLGGTARRGRLPWAAGTAAIVLAASASSAPAALPPPYQRARELAAVVDAAAPLLEEPIDAVEHLSPDRYRVRAGSCTLEVRIRDAPPEEGPPVAGPRRFETSAGEPDCR